MAYRQNSAVVVVAVVAMAGFGIAHIARMSAGVARQLQECAA